MSYTQNDKSVQSGAPIELYDFVAPHRTWRLTSCPRPITFQGETYEPTLITRTALEISSTIDTSSTVDFNVPCDHSLAKTFCYTLNPRELSVVVYRVHEGDDYDTEYSVEYSGEMSGAVTSDKWATIQTASKLQTRLNGNISSVFYQKTCNHVLFDERCKVVREDYTEEAVVLLVQGQLITVDDTHFGNDELVSGVMTNTRTGEQQGIISNAGQLVRVGYRFFDIIPGDVVELTQGCDHQRLGHCKNRYNNVDNYGGFDFVPEKNPFEQLNYEAVTSTTARVRRDQENRITFPPIPSARSI